MYVLALSDYKQPAAAAGYKPAPQIRPTNCSLFCHKNAMQHKWFAIGTLTPLL